MENTSYGGRMVTLDSIFNGFLLYTSASEHFQKAKLELFRLHMKHFVKGVLKSFLISSFWKSRDQIQVLVNEHSQEGTARVQHTWAKGQHRSP